MHVFVLISNVLLTLDPCMFILTALNAYRTTKTSFLIVSLSKAWWTMCYLICCILKMISLFLILRYIFGKISSFQSLCIIVNISSWKNSFWHPAPVWIIAIEVIYSLKIIDTGMTFLKSLQGCGLVMSSFKTLHTEATLLHWTTLKDYGLRIH